MALGHGERARVAAFGDWSLPLKAASLRAMAAFAARLLFCVGFLSGLFGVEVAHAQVNVEPFRARLKEKERLLALRGALTGRTGNTEGLTFGAGGLVGLSGETRLWYLSGSADYERANHATTVAKAFVHSRFNQLLFRPIWGELFAQFEADRFRRVSRRALLGIGPRFELVDESSWSLVYGASYMLELTRRGDAVSAEERSATRHRFNNYVSLTYRPHERITLSETAYYQPRFDAFGDYWLMSAFVGRFEVIDQLATVFDFVVRRESEAPPGVKTTDVEFVNSIALTFD